MKKTGNTKSSIVSAAWELFYRQGYDNTTIDDIVEASNTSKGSFYHYFSGKEGLLNTLSILFDDKYLSSSPSWRRSKARWRSSCSLTTSSST